MSGGKLVYIVEDDEAVRSALQLLLRAEDFQACAFASAEAFLAQEFRRDSCLITDLRLEGMSGLELQEELTRRGADIPVIVMTGFGSVPDAVRAMKKGAVDFIEKPVNAKLLLATLEKVFRPAPAPAKPDAKQAKDLLARLTPRELTILERIADGMSSRKIAEQLGISTRTVEVYRARLMMKIGASGTSDLIKLLFAAHGTA